MKLPEQAMLLRIFIGESDHYKGKPLYEQIVLKARELNLAGATAIRGILGFRRQSDPRGQIVGAIHGFADHCGNRGYGGE